MGVNYHDAIVNALHGNTADLEKLPAQRRDWGGSSAVLAMYEASGADRDDVIQAMKGIIEDAEETPAVLAQLIHIAASLDIVQVAPEVRRLKAKGYADEEPLSSVVTNYLNLRRFRENSGLR